VKKTTEDSSRRGKEAKQEEESLLLDFPRGLSKTCSLLRRFCLWLLSSSSRIRIRRRRRRRRRSERLQIGDPGRKKGVKKEREKECRKTWKSWEIGRPGRMFARKMVPNALAALVVLVANS
jgi:hypothetical protein